MGGSIETYNNDLQSLWQEIDFRHLNRMKCDSDIKEHNANLQEDRVCIFLMAWMTALIMPAGMFFKWLCFHCRASLYFCPTLRSPISCDDGYSSSNRS
ncbi:unnamed protein product [Prunus armeniaca]